MPASTDPGSGPAGGRGLLDELGVLIRPQGTVEADKFDGAKARNRTNSTAMATSVTGGRSNFGALEAQSQPRSHDQLYRHGGPLLGISAGGLPDLPDLPVPEDCRR